MWLISDVRHARRYLNTALLGHKKEWVRAGLLIEAPSLRELAARIDVDPGRLTATVERFNGFARTGVDADFDRGRTVYDNYYGDPRVKPNPNLGPLEKGPFRAVRVSRRHRSGRHPRRTALRARSRGAAASTSARRSYAARRPEAW